MTTLSIIIVTYNPGAILLDCLRSLPAGVTDLTYEVIVVDNASTDGLVQQAQVAFPHHRYILNTDNRGFAGGNNQGLAQATGDYLLLLNPDVIVEPGSLKAMVDFLEDHPRAGIVGPRTLNRNGDLAHTAHGLYTARSVLREYLGLDRLFPLTDSPSPTDRTPVRVAWVQAHCLLLRRQIYEQVGGLDEAFFLFCEDPDLCDRAAKAGWETHFLPDAIVQHIESSTVSRYPERRIRAYHLSPLHYFRKRGQQRQVFLLKIGFTLELLLKLVALPGRKSLYLRVLNEIWRT